VQDCFSRLLDKIAPGIGQLDELLIALEESETELTLKFDNPLAQRRLLDAQPFRRAGKVQFFGQRNRRLQKSNLR